MDQVYTKEALFLPQLPDKFLLGTPEIRKGKQMYPYPSTTFSSWRVPEISEQLDDFLQPYFDFPIFVIYQIIENDMPVHTDDGREFAYNYLLQPGGENIETRWWAGDEVVFSKVFPLHTWHWLNVSIPHDVEKVETERVSVSIKYAKWKDNV